MPKQQFSNSAKPSGNKALAITPQEDALTLIETLTELYKENEITNVHVDLIEGLAQHKVEEVRACLAGSECIRVSPTVIATLIGDDSSYRTFDCYKYSPRLALARNPAIEANPDAIRTLYEKGSHDLLEELARNPAIEAYPDIIREIAESDRRHFRANLYCNLATNPAIEANPDAIMTLVDIGYADVWQWLAANPAIKANPDAIKKLVIVIHKYYKSNGMQWVGESVEEVLATNPAIEVSPEAIWEMAGSPHNGTRSALRANESPKVQRIISEIDSRTRDIVALALG